MVLVMTSTFAGLFADEAPLPVLRVLAHLKIARGVQPSGHRTTSSLKYGEKIMGDARENFLLTRRGLLTLSAGAAVANFSRLYASSSDFWNKKEPSEWSGEEIEKLTTKSPWAKETAAQYSQEQGQGGGGTGYPGGGGGGMGGGGRGGMGGMGIPGMGGGGMGRGRGRGGGQQSQSIKGTVRWESAKPILAAMKTPLPEEFANRYVISVSGFPLNASRRRRSQDDSDTNSSQSVEDTLDNLKALTYLETKGREGVQPGLVQQQPSSGAGSILFGFSKEMLALKPEDKEVTFSTRIAGLNVKNKFNLKEMMYRGELAL